MRRFLIVLIVLTLLVSLFSALGSISYAQPKKYNEAPMLAELVKAGKLPPVEKRLPEEPFIVGPGVLVSKEDLDWEVGKYGGIWRTAHYRPGWNPDVFLAMNESLLAGPGFSTEKIRGNVVRDFSVNKDCTEFIFYMRKGLKWSDGHPVTTRDVLFTYKDVLLNEKITPIFPSKYRSGGGPSGDPMKLEVIDDYTFRIKFSKPYGNFLTIVTLTGWVGYTDLIKPEHYLRRFHINYTPLEAMKTDLKSLGLKDEWWQLFNNKDIVNWEQTREEAVGFPMLTPWIPVKAPPGVLEFERNPYYYKIDIRRNQLPYIDRIRSFYVSDVEMLRMKALRGEMDFAREGISLSDMPVFKEYGEKGDYRVVLYKEQGSPLVFFLNLTYKDPVWRQIVRDLRFRKAINMGINRDDINETLAFGLAPPVKTVPSIYDPQTANRLLDEMGLTKRDDAGYRLRPDGKTLEIQIEYAAYSPMMTQAAEMLAQYLSKLGIKVFVKQIAPELHSVRSGANELMATILWLHSPTWRYGTFFDYLPNSLWAPEWMVWYDTGGKSGEEPPKWIKELYAIHLEIMQTLPTSPRGRNAREKLYSWYNKYIPVFPLLESNPSPVIVSNKLGNIPHSGYSNAINLRGPEQFFFKR